MLDYGLSLCVFKLERLVFVQKQRGVSEHAELDPASRPNVKLLHPLDVEKRQDLLYRTGHET